MKALLKKLGFVCLLLLTACRTPVNIPQEFKPVVLKTSTFSLASWQKLTNQQAAVKIYIEGDGAAFNAYGRPSRDPTPRGTLLREIAFGDMNDNVVYLARPCQFVDDRMCSEKYWTTGRFAFEVIEAFQEAITKIANGREVILVGFSGGAQVAGLTAVKTPALRVKKLVTIEGNLDHRAWTTYHNLPPLVHSLNLKPYQQTYLSIPQVHYVGSDDDIILPELVQDFVGTNNVIVVDGASHGSGLESIYALVRGER